MVVFPGCKINIGLNITGKRDDGFHLLESIFYPINLSDILEILVNDELKLEITGLPIKGDQSDNLVIKAYQLLKKEYNIPPVHIHLHKIVPMGAGLGGGSADGAATLVLLNKIFNLNIPIAKLESFADNLGSDCAFFIRNSTAFISGKGEIILPIDFSLSGYYLQLISPQIHISTQKAFSGIKIGSPNAAIIHTIKQNPATWKGLIKNDFEETIFSAHESIKKIKEKLYDNGAIYASMTGTGSSVYGIFKQNPITFNTLNSKPAYFEWATEL